MKKILIVDDEKDIRFILEEILTENKYSVVTVGTVKEAEDFIRENSFDLALLDVFGIIFHEFLQLCISFLFKIPLTHR